MKKFYFLAFMLCTSSIIFLQAQNIRYVKVDGTGNGNSWSEASSDLQAMIDASEMGDRVYVAAGTYLPLHAPSTQVFQWLTNNLIGETTDKDRTFVLKEGVEVYGSFSATSPETDLVQRDFIQNKSILTTDILENDLGVDDAEHNGVSYQDNYYHAVVAAGFETAAILDGFEIQGGTFVGYDYILVNETMIRRGFGGAFNVVEANVDLRNLIINRSARPGYIRNSTATLTNVEITESMGGVRIKNSEVYIENFKYSDNAGHIYIHIDDNFPETNPSDTSVEVVNAEFARNSGAPAVFRVTRSFDHTVNLSLDRAYFLGNNGTYGVLQVYGGNLKISNSVAFGNVIRNQSGFLKVGTHSPNLITNTEIVNSTIVSNFNMSDFHTGSGGISGVGGNSHFKIRNSILWGNKRDDLIIHINGVGGLENSSIANSIIQNAYDEEGNWDVKITDAGGNSAETPLFTEYIEAFGESFSNGDFSLQAGSYGIDAGDINAYTEIMGDVDEALDIRGNSRVMGNGIDIGAYEYTENLSTENHVIHQKYVLYPNPSLDYVNIVGIDALTFYQIYNVAGQMLQKGNLNVDDSKIAVSQLPKGQYFIRLLAKDGATALKFIKK